MRSPGQKYCRILPNLGWSDVFLIVRLKSWLLKRTPQRRKYSPHYITSHHIRSTWEPYERLHWWHEPSSLSDVAFASCLHYEVTLLPSYIRFLGSKSAESSLHRRGGGNWTAAPGKGISVWATWNPSARNILDEVLEMKCVLDQARPSTTSF